MVCVRARVHICLQNLSRCGMLADRNPSFLNIRCENVQLIKGF